MPSFTRLEIAGLQLERALQLYLDERDYVPAITLASAADAILDRLLETAAPGTDDRSGRRRAAEFTRRWRGFFRHKELIELAEALRTGLRQVPEQDPTFEPDDLARDILERAIAKHLRLAGTLSPRMRRFRALGLDDAGQPADSHE